MASSPRTGNKTRSFSTSIDINATPDDVWRALTEAGELMRWFPLQARVSPGKGGSMFWGWDDHWAWESEIDAWDPGARLRLVERRPAFDVNGKPIDGPALLLAMEFTIEAHEGKTTLRMVHSGFGEGAKWDDELDSVSAGWQYELRGLRHYLEHHKGRDRHHASVHRVTSVDTKQVWTRLLGAGAFEIVEGHLDQDARVVLRAPGDDRIAGRVEWHNPERDLFVTVDDVNDGVFRLCTWRAEGRTGLQIWMVAYDARHAARVQAFGARAQQLIDRLLPEE
jgi:uncharacterized protein YndB with AHSA1/START domain